MSDFRFICTSVTQAGVGNVSVTLVEVAEGYDPSNPESNPVDSGRGYNNSITLTLSRAQASGYFPGDLYGVDITEESTTTASKSTSKRKAASS